MTDERDRRTRDERLAEIDRLIAELQDPVRRQESRERIARIRAAAQLMQRLARGR